MNQVASYIKLKSEIKIQPITIIDTLSADEHVTKRKNVFSKVFRSFFHKEDLTLENWQRLESKPIHRMPSELTKNYYSRGFK